MGSLEISGELQLGVCHHEESHASPHTERKGEDFFCLFVYGVSLFYNFYWAIVALQCCVPNSFCLPDWLLSHFSHVRFFVTPRFFCPWDSPGKNSGVGCCALLWGIFPTQGWTLCPLCLHLGQAYALPLAPPKWKPLSHGQLSVTPWTTAPSDFSVHGILQARIRQ